MYGLHLNMPLSALKHLQGHARQSCFFYLYFIILHFTVFIFALTIGFLSRFVFYLNTKDIGLKKKKCNDIGSKLKMFNKYLATFNHGIGDASH